MAATNKNLQLAIDRESRIVRDAIERGRMEEHADYLLEQRREAESEHDRDWYQENDPQSLVDSINEANAGNPRIG